MATIVISTLFVRDYLYGTPTILVNIPWPLLHPGLRSSAGRSHSHIVQQKSGDFKVGVLENT